MYKKSLRWKSVHVSLGTCVLHCLFDISNWILVSRARYRSRTTFDLNLKFQWQTDTEIWSTGTHSHTRILIELNGFRLVLNQKNKGSGQKEGGQTKTRDSNKVKDGRAIKLFFSVFFTLSDPFHPMSCLFFRAAPRRSTTGPTLCGHSKSKTKQHQRSLAFLFFWGPPPKVKRCCRSIGDLFFSFFFFFYYFFRSG